MRVRCVQCKKWFDKRLSQIKITRNNFCSKSCAAIFNGKKRKGPYKKTRPYLKKIRKLRHDGYGYQTIAKILNNKVHWHTIKYCCKDIKSNKKVAFEKGLKYIELPFEKLKSNQAILKRLIEERGHKCEKCKLAKWLKLPISLELHHIDGNKRNQKKKNLKLHCPNCHSQTDNYKNKK